MNKKQINKLMNILLTITASLILVGAIFKLQHYLYGDQIFRAGIVSSLVLGSFEINRLKKINKTLENKVQETEQKNVL